MSHIAYNMSLVMLSAGLAVLSEKSHENSAERHAEHHEEEASWMQAGLLKSGEEDHQSVGHHEGVTPTAALWSVTHIDVIVFTLLANHLHSHCSLVTVRYAAAGTAGTLFFSTIIQFAHEGKYARHVFPR